MKKVIRLTENDIHRIVKNSVKRILKEDNYDPFTYSNTELSYPKGVDFLDMDGGIDNEIENFSQKIIERYGSYAKNPNAPSYFEDDSTGINHSEDFDLYLQNLKSKLSREIYNAIDKTFRGAVVKGRR